MAPREQAREQTRSTVLAFQPAVSRTQAAALWSGYKRGCWYAGSPLNVGCRRK